MPDRRRRAALLLPPPATAGWYPQPVTAPGMVLLPRERQSSSSSADSPGSSGSSGSPDSSSSGPTGSTDSTDSTGGSSDAPEASGKAGTPEPDRDNPFAPPPPDAPDQEWRPRQHAHGQDHNGDDEQPPQDAPTPTWGSQWSSRQPGRQSGGFGTRPSARNGQQGGGQGGPGNQGGNPGGLRWDPTDPAQRRARYALLAGMWAFFFVLFSQPEIALLLGVLALYWGISSLRAKPGSAKPGSAKAKAAATTAAMEGRPAPTATTPGQPGAPSGPGSTRPQTTAAIAGLVTASLALMMVAATFTVQLVYRDYFTCVDDALTQSAANNCKTLLPEQLRGLLSTDE
ncbi:hypothetical protein ACIQNI_01335 [Streptomyces sp. NPDC091266]|uniref:hypothetical protein n=1 Tax=Streptomyces sp. NPDC091266 TaxID=3365978 RepID=UPI00382BA303